MTPARSEEDLLEFLAHINALAEQAGVELDDEDRQELYEQAEERGFTGDATEALFAETYSVPPGFEVDDEDLDWDEDEDEFLEDEDDEQLVSDLELQLGKLERQRGRGLSDRELTAVTETAGLQMRAARRVDVAGALGDYEAQFATPQARAEFFQRRMQESRPEVEIADEYDLSTDAGRKSYYEARTTGGLSADDFEDAP